MDLDPRATLLRRVDGVPHVVVGLASATSPSLTPLGRLAGGGLAIGGVGRLLALSAPASTRT